MTMRTVILFLNTVYTSADMGGSRYKADMFVDRIAKAATESSLQRFAESLLTACHCESEKLFNRNVLDMQALCGTPESPRILLWLRQSTRLAAAMAITRHDSPGLAEAIAAIELPPAANDADHCELRKSFDIGIHAECLAPLGHGADGKAGNATLFRRIQAIGVQGSVLHLPYYSGNAIRGQLRDLLADHFTAALGMAVSRNKPAYRLWFFHALYAGGSLEDKSDATKAVNDMLGNNGAIRTEGIRTFREMLPALSLLGCALGNRVLPGRIQVSDLRPICREWG